MRLKAHFGCKTFKVGDYLHQFGVVLAKSVLAVPFDATGADDI